MINVIYGVLTGGVVTPDSVGYRRTTATGLGNSLTGLKTLRGLVPSECLGVFAELLIQLMRSDENWDKFIKEVDKDNTYQSALIISDFYLESSDLSFPALLNWARSVSIPANQYSTTNNDNNLDLVRKTLMGLVYTAVNGNI